MLKVAFTLLPPEGWVNELAKKQGVHVHVFDTIHRGGHGSIEDLVYITSQSVKAPAIAEKIKARPDVVDADLVNLGEHQLMGSVNVKECPVCQLFAVADAFLIGADTLEDGRMRWEVFVRDEKALSLLVDELARRGIAYQLTEKTHLKKTELTARQDQILRVALELGYFDFPKHVKLEELAERLGVTAGTLSEVLRRGVKKALREYLSYKHPAGSRTR
ncbi:MAG: helix-turn-helix domain-containing protein [Thermoprotei archaeon]